MIRFIFCVALLLVASISLAEDFSIEKSLSSDEWKIDLPLGGALQPLGDHFQISNRASMYRKGRPKKISFEWFPRHLVLEASQEVKTDNNIRLYGDHLAIVLYSNAKMQRMKDGRGAEVADGLVIKLDAGGGNVWLHDQSAPEESKLLKHIILPREKDKPAISPEWHSISVTDNDKSVSVSLDGKEILSAPVPEGVRKGDHWGFYNREPVGPPGPHISLLRKLQTE